MSHDIEDTGQYFGSRSKIKRGYINDFLPARPASQTNDSHKGPMISNHERPAGRIKNCGEKAAFNICNFRFECFYLRTVS